MTDTPLPKAADARTRWGQDRRLAFIDFRLQFEGRVNRGDLTAFFGISNPQASQDLARYQQLAPANLRYDTSSKMYVSGEHFVPQYGDDEAGSFLNDVSALASGETRRDTSFIGWLPAFSTVPTLDRPIPARLLAGLMASMRNHASLEIEYQSMSREQPVRRVINPHALGHDGFRWHIRAYCHLRKAFCDFVLGRIFGVSPSDAPWIGGESDTIWHTVVSLSIAPNPRLPIAQQRAVALDYGMEGGRVCVECRQALLFYAVRRLGLDDVAKEAANSQQIVLINRDEVAPYLAAMRETTPPNGSSSTMPDKHFPKGLDGRQRDQHAPKAGQIREKRSDTKIATLREEYGPNFAAGYRSDAHLGTVRDATGKSLSQLKKDMKKP